MYKLTFMTSDIKVIRGEYRDSGTTRTLCLSGKTTSIVINNNRQHVLKWREIQQRQQQQQVIDWRAVINNGYTSAQRTTGTVSMYRSFAVQTAAGPAGRPGVLTKSADDSLMGVVAMATRH